MTHLIFTRYLLPKIRSFFPSFPEVTPEAFYDAINVIKTPSFIRVESDEVNTSTLHLLVHGIIYDE
jgi:Zn-dependent M32 family carboxypeptidase